MPVNLSAFRPAVRMTLTDEGTHIAVQILDAEEAALEESVYVWCTPEGEALRVGTSKAGAWSRLRQYPRYINKRLDGLNSETPAWEAEAWLTLLQEHGHLDAVVLQPSMIMTVAGYLRPYNDLERVLIATLRPRLNRSHR